MTDPVKQAERTALVQKLRSAASGVQREELAITDAERRLKQAEDDLKRAKIGLQAERAALVRHAHALGITSTTKTGGESTIVRAILDLVLQVSVAAAPSYPAPTMPCPPLGSPAPPWGKP